MQIWLVETYNIGTKILYKMNKMLSLLAISRTKLELPAHGLQVYNKLIRAACQDTGTLMTHRALY